MLGKNNYKLKRERQANKFYRYSIKRLSIGVASVAVSAGLLFTGRDAIQVKAAEISGEKEHTLTQSTELPEKYSSLEEVDEVDYDPDSRELVESSKENEETSTDSENQTKEPTDESEEIVEPYKEVSEDVTEESASETDNNQLVEFSGENTAEIDSESPTQPIEYTEKNENVDRPLNSNGGQLKESLQEDLSKAELELPVGEENELPTEDKFPVSSEEQVEKNLSLIHI
mgnify:FL=1